MQVPYVQMLVAANELQQRSWLWIYECECVLGGGAISGSAAKSLTDGLFQGETSASCWQMSCEKRNKLWTQTLERPPFWFPLPPSLCPLLVYSFFHFLLPFQIIKFTACFPGSAAFVLHSCFSFPPSSLPGLLRPTLLTPIFLLSHHIHLYSFHLSLIYNHSASLPHFPLFLFLIMIITQLFLFLYGSMTRLPSLLPLAASFLHSSTSISFHLFDSPLPVSLLSCSAFSCFSSISCCSSIIIIPVFSSLFFISICLLIFLTSPPLLLTPSSFQTSHSQASRPASHFLLPLPFPFVFLHWDLLSYLKLSAGSGDFLQPRPWKRRPSAGSSPSTLGINKRCSVVEVLKMLTCCGCSLTAWVLMLVRRHVLGVQTLLQV